eukprot:TRINITY_DN12886_c0_g2_i2.p1 TRINITY_DN12886_c0_g2~~TRINITY_DN12886_c0_g2_i2.p1  ORF type:complete len:253 (-),score=55.31 TRINITY_DN12886_c0_g2_i2:104-862(-)
MSFTGDDDVRLFAAVMKPSNFKEGVPHPTVIYLYGGPHVQLVRNHYALTMNPLMRLMCSFGYVVGVVDNRGSFNRGLKFEGMLKHKMGQVEVQDQVKLVKTLVDAGITDPKRVAVSGWSYGGYMTLMCMSQRPDVFKIGVSGAPVTFWEAYDTGYTERYMGTPKSNPEGYTKGSVITYVNGFPDEANRLVIAHGLLDENVHFLHTARLVEALVKANKPYILKLFPEERHGLRKGTSSSYFYNFVAEFLEANL